MRSQEVYKFIHNEIGNSMKELSMKKGQNTQLSYIKKVANEYLVIWFQCDHFGWDKYAGSSFCVNIQKSMNPGLGITPPSDLEKLNTPEKMVYTRIPEFFTPDELKEVFEIQNWVITTIPKPPQNYIDEILSGFKQSKSEWLSRTFLDNWSPIVEPYKKSQDIWFRYFTQEHVLRWTHFLLGPIKRAILTTESLSINELNEKISLKLC